MQRWRRWVVRIVLGAVAFFVLIFGVLLILNPSGTLIFTVRLLLVLFSTNRPPPIAHGIITADDRWQWDAASRKMTNILETKFPAGTPEAAMRSALLKEGFKPLRAAANCDVPRRPVALRLQCQPVLQYSWRNVSFVSCEHTISVEWKTDDTGKIIGIKGSYFEVCL
jgi:hypothetical protein